MYLCPCDLTTIIRVVCQRFEDQLSAHALGFVRNQLRTCAKVGDDRGCSTQFVCVCHDSILELWLQRRPKSRSCHALGGFGWFSHLRSMSPMSDLCEHLSITSFERQNQLCFFKGKQDILGIRILGCVEFCVLFLFLFLFLFILLLLFLLPFPVLFLFLFLVLFLFVFLFRFLFLLLFLFLIICHVCMCQQQVREKMRSRHHWGGRAREGGWWGLAGVEVIMITFPPFKNEPGAKALFSLSRAALTMLPCGPSTGQMTQTPSLDK